MSTTSNTSIAIVGLGCILPDAANPSAFWANLLAGHSSLRPLSRRTYAWDCYARAAAQSGHVFEDPVGAELQEHPFDWRKFKISPLDAQAINPMHLHVLEAGAQALEEVKSIPHATTGLFLGGTGLGWRRDSGLRIRLPEFLAAANAAAEAAGMPSNEREALLAQTRRSLEERLRPVSDDGVVNSLGSIAVGRLALRYDLRGPHAGIDAGFASGLAAVAEAMQLLRDGTIDLALAGGASESITPLDLLAFHRLAVLARHRVRPFDAEAEGTLLGEGMAFFALKRLDDALADGERIYAVIRGMGASSDGRSRSLLSPSADGQSLAMQRAYDDAEIDPATIGYVECHATGTAVGDASEIQALSRIFRGGPHHSVAVGSAKPFVGHLRGASGAVGLLRAVLALYHRTIPAQIGFDRPHPNLAIESTPFFVPVSQIPLEPRANAPAARASVSSFGLGGINYHAVLEAWTPDLQAATPKPTRQATRASEPIAIVGLGGVLPGSSNVAEFWKALEQGQDATHEVPDTRFAISRYYDPDHDRLDTSYTRIGCFVEPAPDPGREFRVPPAARIQIDPGQIFAFRAAEEAIADSGLEATAWDRDRTAVILGFLGCQGRRMLAEARMNFFEFRVELEANLRSAGIAEARLESILSASEASALSDLPAITEDTLPGYLGSINAARVARRFDLKGPHFVVDSACASSLAALHGAVRLLRQGQVDTVLLGGVWGDGQPEFFVQNCRFSALSATGITPFDERANGFVPGEGAAVLVLRRLADAERDGQRIHALIRSVEGSSDGGAGRSIYSPCVAGEALAIRRALEAAALSPSQVDYVECHGTGTALGDVTEIQACTEAYGGGRQRPLLVGSVKSNVGHLMAGAGAAALLKTTLAIREGRIPASLKVDKLNPKIDFATGPVEVVTSMQDWNAPAGEQRRAGVSAFGLGGTNFHAVLEEYRPVRAHPVTSSGGGDKEPSRARALPIATSSGADLPSCARTLRQLAADLRECGEERYLATLAAAQRESARQQKCRIAIVANEPGLLLQRSKLLSAALDSGRELSFLRAQGIFVSQFDQPVRAAAVFPGQGPQYPNMLRSAAAAFPELNRSLERIDRAYESICGRKLSPSFFTEDTDAYQQCDEDIHCAVFAVNVALFELLQSFGAKFEAVMGQSAGELAALVAARSVSLEDGLRAIRERTLSVLDIRTADPGRMITLSCGAGRAQQLMRDLPGYAALAADNGPSACIVSADQRAVQVLVERATNAGLQANVLAVSHGYHSQLIAAAQPRYQKALDSIAFERPNLAFFSSITGESIEQLPVANYPAHLVSQFVEPVRLQQAVTAMHQSGVRLFIECGPKWPLTTFISEILAGRPHIAQATLHPKVGEVEQLNRALACLFVHGVCQLSPIRESNMSIATTAKHGESDTVSPASPISSATPLDTARLLEVLRSIRELIDVTLAAVEVGHSEARPESLAAMEHIDNTSVDLEDEPASDPSTSSPLSSSVVALQEPMALAPSMPVAIAAAELFDAVHASVRTELIKRTGYPEDMLDLDLDLEAELGIDTVKQVAALAAVREQYGLAPDPTFRMQDARTLRQAVEYLVRRVTATSTANSVPLGAPAPLAVAQKPALLAPPPVVIATPAVKVQCDARAHHDTSTSASAITEQVRALLVSEIVTRTHYPEDMLELDLDLEAELGIDTVKQVAALAAVREKFQLPPDPQFRMQDARTLRQAIDYLAGRIQGKSGVGTKSDNVQIANSTSDIPTKLTVAAAEPAEPNLEPGQRAALPKPNGKRSNGATTEPTRPFTATPTHAKSTQPGIANVDSIAPPPAKTRTGSLPAFASALNEIQEYVRSLALLIGQEMRTTPVEAEREHTAPAQQGPSNLPKAPRSVYPGALMESILPQADCSWDSEVLELRELTVTGADAPPPDVTAPDQGDLPMRASAAEGHVVARSRRVPAMTTTPSAPPDMLDAVREGRSASDVSQLRDYLVKSGRDSASSMEWVHSSGFAVTVGGARVSTDSLSPGRMMSDLLGSAFDVTSYAWFGFTGALHALSAIERLRFHRMPKPGEEILICARTTHPEGGFWRADVLAFDQSGALFAELSGLEGIPLSQPSLAANALGSDPADRAWRRFARRLGRELDLSQDLAS